ncbi:MAG: thioredoxin family protein [Chitinophagaceae bacterium]|nr:thioredoxin family protein [Chitinophagaceae bacterium]
MNKKIFITGALVVIVAIVFACLPKSDSNPPNVNKQKGAVADAAKAEKGIQFMEESWTKALAAAKKQNKMIFLDAYTSWCGPCKMLKRNTFPDPAAGEFFNTNFINVAIDMEKGEGPAVAEKFSVNAYPTLIFADSDGNLITYTKGYIDAKQLLEFGKFGLSKRK